MGGFFTRERFGRPQVLAGLLLLVFLAQCAWLVQRRSRAGMPSPQDAFRTYEGSQQWEAGAIAGTPAGAPASSRQPLPFEVESHGGYDPNHSPMWYLVAGAPFALAGRDGESDHPDWAWLASAPYLVFGVLLGASLWYVSRRLYGNAGGYIALLLYCFSPGIIRASALWYAQPEIGAAWGSFGTVFTSIAVAHTLYAPREVVLWNWRRIVLLGLSLALAVGSQFSLIIVVPIALAFLLYLAPERRRAAAAIWAAGCGLGFMLLFASYWFRPGAFWESIQHASFFAMRWKAMSMAGAYRQLGAQLGQISPALVLAVPLALTIYVAWPRTRYFGNTAPLSVAVLFLLLGLGNPHYPGLGFQLLAVPFLFVFVAGVLSDLLETRQSTLVLASIGGLLGAYALWSLMQLARVG